MSKVAERIEKLREEIRRHDCLYFVKHAPEISDREYDQLVSELKDLEAEHPELITPDSPTQRVGEQPTKGFPHVRHAAPMLSIDNTYNEDDLRDFDRRVAKGLGTDDYQYLVDPKIDGVAVSVRYEDGRLTLGATRGDGQTGDEITTNVRAIRSIPLKLRGDDWPRVVEVRGEIYWPTSNFNAYNDKRVKRGEEAFKNPRNATAGTLKQLDPRIVAERGLYFQCHGFGEIEPFPRNVERFSQLLERFGEWGVPVGTNNRVCESIDQVIAFVEEWAAKRHQLEYETDGLVLKLDNLTQRDELGATSKAPRWCIAYKYAAEQAESRIESITLQVGKLGTITPVANLEPVELAGTTVKRASLHNFDQIDRLNLHYGDVVTVEKAGEIIPQVVAVDATRRAKDAKAVGRPRKCPECGGEVGQDEGGVYLRCMNPACPAQRLERLKYFAGRDQMDIEGLGTKLVETLVDKNLVETYGDIYRLPDQRDKLLELERMGEKSVDNLLNAIEESKGRPLSRVLAALNIRHIGGTAAELLANHFGDVDKLTAADEESLQEVEGVGPETARAVRQFFDSEVGRKAIEDLKSVGVNFKQPKALRKTAAREGPLTGKTLVVTGTLEHFSRKEIEDLIKQHGGKATGTVSKNTDYLVAGANAGSKLDRAKSLNVPVLTEADFRELIGR